MKKVIHLANTRGNADYGWLKANYSFSFANHYDPERVQFGKLRVLNDDTVQAGMGFGTHSHDNMEIISIPLKGLVKHRDSMDNSEVINAGEVQVMSAGTGIEHSEFNSSQEELNMLQLWIFPEKPGLKPRYEQRNFAPLMKLNELTTIVTPKNKTIADSLWINQDAWLSMGEFENGRKIEYTLHNEQHGVYMFVIDGEVEIEGTLLEKRDGIGIWKTSEFTLNFNNRSKVLLIEVPMD
ncbi:pirin family protein [Gramella sp. AN32]|uniref:Pirin family protein n=1 Tax=Christiangramia antarctica TaxID=2058158 RepID=A0ABW5XD13_9FLAO|nr:pirin family protein [Gramella sp. AN32]MCM4156520.1 hypothetical protein [Gramella sp. AN32]